MVLMSSETLSTKVTEGFNMERSESREQLSSKVAANL